MKPNSLHGIMNSIHHVKIKDGLEFDMIRHASWSGEGQNIYEPEVSAIMERFVEPGDTVVDVGANVGWFTCLMSRIVGDAGLVISFEPDQDNLRMLINNVQLNQLNNVYVGHQMIWSKDCWKDFWIFQHGGYSSYIKYDGTTHQRLLARSLDSLLFNNTVAPPRLIKLDCEGSEWAALRGAEKILRRGVDAVIVEFNFNIFEIIGLSERTVREFMYGLGYDFFLLGMTKPIYVEPKCNLVGRDGCILNTMFSTKKKVDQLWAN
jgi:FkbM family methyltransferase